MVWSVGSLKWNQQTSELNWTYPMFLSVLLLYVGHQVSVFVCRLEKVCVREKKFHLVRIWLKLAWTSLHICGSSIFFFPTSPAFSVNPQFSLPPTPRISNANAKEVSLIRPSTCTPRRQLCALSVHICLCVRVSTSLPLPFTKEAPRAWFNMVNKAPTVSQSCWGVHREPVNGCIFPLLYGHNKSLNLQDQKTDSTAASLVEMNETVSLCPQM